MREEAELSEGTLHLFGQPVEVGGTITEEMLLAMRIVCKDSVELRNLRARPDMVRHALGLCVPPSLPKERKKWWQR